MLPKMGNRDASGRGDPYRKLATSICRQNENFLSLDSIWNSLFVGPFKADAVMPKPLFVIIDGVDEATLESQELLVKMAKALSDMWSKRRKLPAIQLLLLGRPDLDYNVSNAWRGERRRPRIIHIQPSLSRADIERFIRKGVHESIPLLHKMRPIAARRLRKEIIVTLGNRSDGMFMLAKLMLAEIKDMNKPELIREALSKPPVDLDDMFRRVITRLTVTGGFDKADLNEIIMWVSCAKRDLLLGELDLVLKLRDLQQNGIIGLEDELRTRFGSFFTIASADSDIIGDRDDISIVSGTIIGQSVPSTTSQNTNTNTDSDDWIDVYSENEDDDDMDRNYGEYDDSDKDDDVEDEEEVVPYKFFVATVKFGHASVGQYFRLAPFHEGIGIDINLSQTHIALTCVQFLTGNIPTKSQRPWRQPDLFQYASDHFLDHLADIQPRASGFEELTDEILVLMRDQVRLYRWFQSVSDEHKFICKLFSQSTCSRLQELIPKPGVQVDTGPDTQRLPKAKTSPEFLLEPFAKAVVEAWLLLGSCDGIMALMFLRAYMSIRSDAEPWTPPANRPFEHIAESISPEEIQQFVLLGTLEKTGHFHFILGRTLARIKTRKHLVAAVEEFRSATQKSSEVEIKCTCRLEEAKGLYALEEYGEAVVAASQALEGLPANELDVRLELLNIIQEASLRLGDEEAAFETAFEAWNSAPHSLYWTFVMIHTSHHIGRFSSAVETIRSVINEPQRGPGFLAEIMNCQPYASEYILNACSEMDQLDFAHDVFTAVSVEATKSGDSSRRALADAALAQLHYRYHRTDDKAIKVWENIVRNYPGTLGAVKASFELAPVYFTMATDPETEDIALWISKLEQLAGQCNNTQTTWADHDGVPMEALWALVGRWNTQRGEVDLARAQVLPLLKLGIRDLTDRIEDNDRQAYFNLATAFLAIGDRRNAEIAFAFPMPLRKSNELLEFEASMNNERPDETKALELEGNTDLSEPFNFVASCDARCNRRLVDFRSFSMCEICIDIGFCDECLQKLKEGTLPFRVCNPRHPHVRIYPPRGLVTKKAGAFMVQVDAEKVVSADSWLEMISQEWLGA
ncbi:hypothetical protein F4777DRAFT_45190 [Nemania sp. FL0916]|nr:hypothetical protein F4777DRAFT_45190 [Nemania sp. FL0916]